MSSPSWCGQIAGAYFSFRRSGETASSAAEGAKRLHGELVGHLSTGTIEREMRRWAADMTRELDRALAKQDLIGGGDSPLAPPPTAKQLPSPLILDYRDGHVWCDVHFPFYIPEIVEASLSRAASGPEMDLYIAGDMFDLHWASRFLEWGVDGPGAQEAEFKAARELWGTMTEVFRRIVIIPGNHDSGRFKRMSGGTLGFEQLLEMVLGIRIADQGDKLVVGHNRWMVLEGSPWGDWRITHPDNARKNPFSLPQALAELNHQNILCAHQHYLGACMDRSGRYLLCEGGFMGDESLMGYKHETDSTHSNWTPGYVELLGGWPHTVSHPAFCKRDSGSRGVGAKSAAGRHGVHGHRDSQRDFGQGDPERAPARAY